jgi:hypothetical protein
MAPWFGIGMIDCTEPLPNDLVPSTIDRRWSCSAPATISEAEAEPPLIRITIGLPSIRSPDSAFQRCASSLLRPRVETISPLSMKSSLTAIAWSSRPPGLLRRSSTKPCSWFLLASFSLVMASWRPLSVFSLKLEMRT